jgi:hypothetical protein
MVFCPEKPDNAVNYAIEAPTGSYFVKKNPHQPRPLDRTDRLILKYLQEDGRLSNVALAKKVNHAKVISAATPPCWSRAWSMRVCWSSSRSTCCALRPTRFETFAAKQKSCPNCSGVTWYRAISTTC